MKRIAQLLVAITLMGTASAQTSFLQRIKDKFAPSSQQKTAKPNAGQAQPAQTAKPTAGAATTSKPTASKPGVTNASVPAVAGKSPASAAAKQVTSAAASKTATSKTAAKTEKAPAMKISVAPVAPQPKQGAQKTGPFSRPKKIKQAKAQAPAKSASKPETPAAEATAPAPETKEKKMITAEGRRDPFLSPVVNSPTGPGCSTGKRCLAIDQIIVRGVVKSDSGMIAVVVNAVNKAYFLKENDPVFNGYVMKITGDSVVFKETYQDKLGKEFTREIVKKITTPAV